MFHSPPHNPSNRNQQDLQDQRAASAPSRALNMDLTSLENRRRSQLGQLTRKVNAVNSANLSQMSLVELQGHQSAFNKIQEKHQSLIDSMYCCHDVDVDSVLEAEGKFADTFDKIINLIEEQIKIKEGHRRLMQITAELKYTTNRIEACFAMMNSKKEESTLYYNNALENVIAMDSHYRELLNDLEELGAEDEFNKWLGELNGFIDNHFRVCSWLRSKLSEEHFNTPKRCVSEMSFQDQPVSKKNSVRCPKISLPTFDGKIESWTKFKDLFMELIHKNDDFGDMQKFQYLEACIKIPSGQVNVLNNFSLKAENYKPAWKAVCDRYEDKRRIIATHLSNLFAVKKMSDGSSNEIRKLIDTIDSSLSSLEQMGYMVTEADDLLNLIIVHHAVSKLDDETLRDWRKYHREDTAQWCQFRKFLVDQWRSLDDNQSVRQSHTRAGPRIANANIAAIADSKKSKCTFCGDIHQVWYCSLSIDDKWSKVREKNLCFNCLGSNHYQPACPNQRKCKKCNMPHHSTLHRDVSAVTGTAASNPSSQISTEAATFKPFSMEKKTTVAQEHESDYESTVAAQKKNICTAVTNSLITQTRRTVLLSTVLVEVEDVHGQLHSCRALLDQGSEGNFVSERMAKIINIPSTHINMKLTGIDNRNSMVNREIQTKIFSHYGPFDATLDFAVLKDISSNIPGRSIDVQNVDIPKDIVLADPHFSTSAKVDMLLNNEIFCKTLLPEKTELASGIVLLHTMFGWTVGGSVQEKLIHSMTSTGSLLSCKSHHARTGTEEIDRKLDLFFTSEDVDAPAKVLTAEEQFCENLFKETTTVSDDGKFVVTMPFKEGYEMIGSNYRKAMQQSYAQESRRKKNENLDHLYVAAMQDFIDSGHMSEVNGDLGQKCHYLPHHGVLKMSSTSTKLRPVFNASSISESGFSLNDVLCVGPTVQPESYDIMLHLREFKYIITADIKQMYRQIWVHPSQRNYLRVLWRPDFQSSLRHYQSNTVTFGTACAPYLATRCLKEIANNYRDTFPEVSQTLEKSFYVDDLTKGVDSIEEGKNLIYNLRHICAQSGFLLTKFAANHPSLLEDVPYKDLQTTDANKLQISKTLGVVYNTDTDDFSYDVKPSKEAQSTKASVLSEIASIYDLLGWLGPVVMRLKLFMQKLWKNKVDWKEFLTDEDQKEWDLIRTNITMVNQLRIKRYLYIEDHQRIEIHGFCDASIVGYGAVIYALSFDSSGNSQVSILTAKSRVAPTSIKSLPRLELCGATLLAKLTSRILSILMKKIDAVTLWSDSTIALSWIALDPHKLQTYVANRVAVIQQLTHSLSWKHIDGTHNPADVLSRGLLPKEIHEARIWFEGPDFLRKPQNDWPTLTHTINEQHPDILNEMKRNVITMVVQNQNDTINIIETRYSSLKRLTNFFGLILRCVDLWKRKTRRLQNVSKKPSADFLVMQRWFDIWRSNIPRRVGPLHSFERIKAEQVIVRYVQEAYFSKELSIFMRQKNGENNHQFVTADSSTSTIALMKNSPLISLSPFIDEDGIIRVGGRLQNDLDLSYNKRHPMVLPPTHFAKLIVREVHTSNLHLGQATMKAHLREKYWILNSRNLIRKVASECLICFRARPPIPRQLMADLPAARLAASAPFIKTALDYAGYFMIKSGTTRRAPLIKAYVAVFKCMVTGAVHLELASDLSANEFINVLERFVSRRGICEEIYSDNATCFEGSNSDLKRIIRELEIASKERVQQIKWIFTTPRAPHAGGYYEAGVKSMKFHLKRVMNGKTLTFEQFSTVLCKIEAILNSRPLTALSEDPKDLEVLTPGHFLVFRPLISLPQRNFIEANPSHLSKWQLIRQVTQSFWSQWSRELHKHQIRPANFRESIHYKVGDLVLVVESNLPPMKWLIGRITQIYPGKDNITRTVEVFTNQGTKIRHVKYLCLIPFINAAAAQNVPSASENDGKQQTFVIRNSNSLVTL